MSEDFLFDRRTGLYKNPREPSDRNGDKATAVRMNKLKEALKLKAIRDAERKRNSSS